MVVRLLNTSSMWNLKKEEITPNMMQETANAPTIRNVSK
jgi:hypothetical protein